MSDPGDHNTTADPMAGYPMPDSFTKEMQANYRRGRAVAGIGIAGFVPCIALAVFWAEYRFALALGVLFFFVIWKTGRTMMKKNSPEG